MPQNVSVDQYSIQSWHFLLCPHQHGTLTKKVPPTALRPPRESTIFSFRSGQFRESTSMLNKPPLGVSLLTFSWATTAI